MSWNFNFRAPSREAAMQIVSDEHERMPEQFGSDAKSVVLGAIAALPELADSEIAVSTFGHFAPDGIVGTSNMTVTVGTHLLPAGATKVTDDQIRDAQGG